jgi:L-aminopeptidase/D-esterase-like protein
MSDPIAMARQEGRLTDVPGLLVGHWTDRRGMTGCTVVLCPRSAVAGVDIRGGAPGTRETELLEPTRSVKSVHAVLLTGGSAYGLDAASGVMRWLEERDIGYDVRVARVPIVPAAVVFDLAVGPSSVRPDAAAGYAACAAAVEGDFEEGSVGAGTGCTVGNFLGMSACMKSGIGTASMRIGHGVVVSALAAVNAFGDVVDPDTGQILAGARRPDGSFANTATLFQGDLSGTRFGALTNTTLAVVATSARLTPAAATKVAQMAHDGLARAIRPVHTGVDGDAVFALSLGEADEPLADPSPIGAAAALVVARAIVRGTTTAQSLAGIPGLGDGDVTTEGPTRRA